MDPHAPRNTKELRRFGFALTGGLTLLGSLLLWRDKAPALYVLGAAGLMLFTALLFPAGLRPIEKVFARVARAVTAAVTYVVLVLAFYLVITPIGLLVRLMGKDSLGLKRAPERESFWQPVDPEGPTSRPDKPY